MKNYSNRYIFLYISTLVLVIAIVLSVVSLGLKSRQEANRKQEKIMQILRAAGYTDVNQENAISLFDNVAQRDASSQREMYGIRCADNSSGKVIYVDGKGLWGAIWGYVILADDNSTIKGVVFSHKSETPGLGANITDEAFSHSFIGKKILNENGKFVSIQMVKGESNLPEAHRVDAISGATITSKGVQDMLYNSLKEVIE